MKVLISFVFLVAFAAARIEYNEYQILSVGPLKNKKEVDLLQGLRDEDERTRRVLLLNDVISTKLPVDLVVAPEMVKKVKAILDLHKITYTTASRDVGKDIMQNAALNEKQRMKQRMPCSDGQMPEFYMRYGEISDYLLCMQNRHSSIASRISIGNSFLGQTIYGLQITAAANPISRVWFDGGIHAREWAATSTSIYMMWRILEGTDVDAIYMRNNFHWYIFPSTNPDGYEYTFNSDRMWRKTRQPYGVCTGADPNRNFDFEWGVHGTDNTPCSDTYGGPNAWSEPETQRVRDAVLARQNGNMHILISAHSYSQLWLVNWAGRLTKPVDYPELQRVGNAAASAIQAEHGRSFTVGTPPDILYAASGGTFDWAKETGGVKYCYSPELRPATAAQGGFELPPTQIVECGEEIFAGVVAVCREAQTALAKE